MHLADAFIQSYLQCLSGITHFRQYMFPGNRAHKPYAANAMLYHWATGKQDWCITKLFVHYKSSFCFNVSCNVQK